MRIIEAARKHGIADEDMLHAIRQALRALTDDDVTMFLGPARNGALLEVGVLGANTDDPVVIHAMPMRDKFNPYL